jgi:Domain of unknown function (DUF4349)
MSRQAMPAAGPTAWGVAGGSGGEPNVTADRGLAEQPSPAPTTRDSSSGQVSPAAQDLSKIARDGSISLEVNDGSFQTTFGRVSDIATRYHGMVLSSSTEGQGTGTLTLRVPARSFDRAFTAVAELGTVLSSASKGQDVTAEYVDLQAHLKILKAKRAFLFGLFEKVTTIEQSVVMENRLEDVQLQIDQIQGRINYIDAQVAESTLRVDIREQHAPEQATQESIESASLGRAWDRGIQGFTRVIAAVVVGLGYLIPIAVLAGIALLVVTLVRRRGHEAS